MPPTFNEMYQDGAVRPPYAQLEDWTRQMPDALRQMKQAVAAAFSAASVSPLPSMARVALPTV